MTIKFKWDPFLLWTNETSFLDKYITHEGQLQIDATSAAILLFGGGLWHSLHEGDAFETFKKDVQTPLTLATRLNPNQKNQSLGSDEALVLLTPVHKPDYGKLDRYHSQSITPQKVNQMNSYLRSVDDDVNLLWCFQHMTDGLPNAYIKADRRRVSEEGNLPYTPLQGGLHVVDGIADLKADIILNLKCNALLASRGQYPMFGTCCADYYVPSKVESMLVLVAVAISYTYAAQSVGLGLSWLLQRKVLRAALVIVLAASYCYVTDRTRIFNKEHRVFRLSDFLLMTGVCGVVGMLSVNTRPLPCSTQQPLSPSSDTPFLPRDITEEWKGWMQAVILIYHYTGASQTLWIYQLIRLMVASYLFMTGYGHTLYFLQKNDYSLKRVTNVLLRLNLLSCVLPYAMRTDYMFYYFAPLTSFWFLIVYLTMRFQHEKNSSTLFVLGKIAISLIFTLAFIHINGLLESIFALFGRTCNIHWSLHEFRFRVSLDMFIVHTGMLFALWQHHSYHNSQSLYPSQNRLLTLLSLFTILTYPILLHKLPTKPISNFFHPFLSPLPVLAYAHLRTSTSFLRCSLSRASAGLGRCSLETFTLQFHIWLAADTKALLRTGIFGEHGLLNSRLLSPRSGSGRMEDLVVLTPLFLAVSWAVARATGEVSRWVIEGGEGMGEDRSTEKKRDGSQSEEKKRDEGVCGEKGLAIEGEVWSLRRSVLMRAGGLRRTGLAVRIGVILGFMWIANWMS